MDVESTLDAVVVPVAAVANWQCPKTRSSVREILLWQQGTTRSTARHGRSDELAETAVWLGSRNEDEIGRPRRVRDENYSVRRPKQDYTTRWKKCRAKLGYSRYYTRRVGRGGRRVDGWGALKCISEPRHTGEENRERERERERPKKTKSKRRWWKMEKEKEMEKVKGPKARGRTTTCCTSTVLSPTHHWPPL